MATRTEKFYSESWWDLDWTKFEKSLFRLQKRVYAAIRANDKRKAKKLQNLILKSSSARFLAIRQVTQLNHGKKTAGVDGKTALTFKERFDLEKLLKASALNWKHQGLREIPIPKKDGSTRMLKVPTISDRAWQAIAKFALEPAHEATFHARSYGFRPGRGTHDAQKIIFLNLRSYAKGKEKRVLELDISKCFDRISHKSIMDRLICPNNLKLGIFRCLKSGTDINFPEQGTPQGGVVSPLLANIALNGIERIGEFKQNGTTSICVRYADDMVYFLRPQDNAEELLRKIKDFLAERGMEISEKKTKLSLATDGFDFLGWHFKVQNNEKFRSTPSVDNFKAFRKKVKSIINSSNLKLQIKVEKLSRIIRGWRQYHKYCKMDGSRFSLWHMRLRAFKVFNKGKNTNKYQAIALTQEAFPSVPYSENKFVNVKGNKSPFDGDLIYWSKRKNLKYDGTTARLLKKQKFECGRCGLKFVNEEKIHLHHKDGQHDNWKPSNLVVMHESCHDQEHHRQGYKRPEIRERSAEKSARCDLNERGEA